MTTTPGQATAAEMYRATAIARHRAEALIACTVLKIREHAHELVIFNPADPEKARYTSPTTPATPPGSARPGPTSDTSPATTTPKPKPPAKSARTRSSPP
jgi:hypothetical protein